MTVTVSPTPVSAPHETEAEAKQFIYMHESGNRPTAVNSIGACGLGQALPCSKMSCPLTDYQCQDNWFTDYMRHRYGTWANAKQHWLARVPINGHDAGNWW